MRGSSSLASIFPTAMFSRAVRSKRKKSWKMTPDGPAQGVEVVLAEVDAVEEDAALGRVVQAGEELDERGLAGPVLAHEGDALRRGGCGRRRPARPTLRARVAEAHPLEHEPLPDRGSGSGRLAESGDPRLHGQEVEQVLEVEALPRSSGRCDMRMELMRLRLRWKEPMRNVRVPIVIAPTTVSYTMSADGAVVGQGREGGEDGAGGGAVRGHPPVLAHVLVGQVRVLPDEVVGEAEELDLLGRPDLRGHPAVVVELPPLLRPLEHERVGDARVRGLPEEGGEDRREQDEHEPRVERDERGEQGRAG